MTTNWNYDAMMDEIIQYVKGSTPEDGWIEHLRVQRPGYPEPPLLKDSFSDIEFQPQYYVEQTIFVDPDVVRYERLSNFVGFGDPDDDERDISRAECERVWVVLGEVVIAVDDAARERLRTITQLAMRNRLCHVIIATPPDERDRVLAATLEGFIKVAGPSELSELESELHIFRYGKAAGDPLFISFAVHEAWD